MTGNWWAILGLYVLIGVGVFFIRSAATPYLRAIAELNARNDKLDLILAEVSGVTQVQKEIEATISGNAWNRERAYELKRDSYIYLLRTLGRLTVATDELLSFARITDQGTVIPDDSERYQKVTHQIDSFLSKLNSERYLYQVLLGEHVFERLKRMAIESESRRDIRAAITAYDEAMRDISSFARRDLYWMRCLPLFPARNEKRTGLLAVLHPSLLASLLLVH